MSAIPESAFRELFASNFANGGERVTMLQAVRPVLSLARDHPGLKVAQVNRWAKETL